uniref:Uncharacterized protein n=1 Tax=Arundo donax TaxID=35708 RepID=A0A0A9H2V1_ARUDO
MPPAARHGWRSSWMKRK